MQVIHRANENIAKLWSVGKMTSDSYRLLTYLIPIDVTGGTLMCNTVTGEMVFLNNEEMKNITSLPCEYAQWMDELIKKHFLVKLKSDDTKTIEALRTAMRIVGSSKEISAYVVALTTNCNARCFYCYQYGAKHENMTDATADKLVDFIEANHGNKEVSITWFGGEPLLEIRQIDKICKGLKEKNIPFKSRMISNGYLFNEEIVKRIKNDWNFTDVQITLDGTEKVYNKIKSYVNPCENPFRRVMQNIEYLIDNDIKVNIRINLGFHNDADLMILTNEIVERFHNKKNLYAYIAMLYDDCGSKPYHLSDGDVENLHEKRKPLSQKVSSLGLRSHKATLPHLISVQCMADGDDCVLISPTGKIGKCEHYINDHFVGDIETGITDKSELKYISERKIYPHCGTCVLFPACVQLKICSSRRECIPLRTEALIDGIKTTMKDIYEEFLRNDKDNAEPNTDCRKENNNEKI